MKTTILILISILLVFSSCKKNEIEGTEENNYSIVGTWYCTDYVTEYDSLGYHTRKAIINYDFYNDNSGDTYGSIFRDTVEDYYYNFTYNRSFNKLYLSFEHIEDQINMDILTLNDSILILMIEGGSFANGDKSINLIRIQ